MANNSKQCFNTHYQSHCHPTTKSLWLCSSVYCRPPHQSRRIWLVAAATNQKHTLLFDATHHSYHEYIIPQEISIRFTLSQRVYDIIKRLSYVKMTLWRHFYVIMTLFYVMCLLRCCGMVSVDFNTSIDYDHLPVVPTDTLYNRYPAIAPPWRRDLGCLLWL